MATLFHQPFKPDASGELPPPDAVEKVLPEYSYIFYDPNRKVKAEPDPLDEQPSPETSGSNRSPDLQANQASLVDYQLRELENYRLAVQKMGKDIIQLRDHIHDVEEDNSMLRRQLNSYEEARKELLDMSAAELDSMDKKELIIRYMTLKQRVHTQSTEIGDCRVKITNLRSELLKQSENRKEHEEMKKAHMAQARALQSMQEKAKKAQKLEQACRSQEKVIENMEKVLKSKKLGETSKALSAENQRLREELQQAKKTSTGDDDRLKLYEELEKAESRISSLEKTLSENSRAWARERQDLQIRLQESELGLGRPHAPPDDYLRPAYSYDPVYNSRYASPRLAPIRR